MPFLAFEDRGARIIAYPSGTQITRPVRSIFVSPGVRSVSSKTARSNATAPGVLYTGKGTSGSSRRIIHGMFIDSHFASFLEVLFIFILTEKDVSGNQCLFSDKVKRIL